MMSKYTNLLCNADKWLMESGKGLGRQKPNKQACAPRKTYIIMGSVTECLLLAGRIFVSRQIDRSM